MSDAPPLARRQADKLPVPALSVRRVFDRVTYVGKVSVATCVAVVLLWWVAARLEVVPAMFLPSPFAVASKFFAV